MADPVTTGIASAVAGGAIDYIRNYIQNSDDPEKAWEEAVRECVIQARVSFRQNHKEVKFPDLDGLRQEIKVIGKSSRELAVRGKLREYDDDVLDLIGEFATACADMAGSPKYAAGTSESEFESQLSELGSEIIEKTD